MSLLDGIGLRALAGVAGVAGGGVAGGVASLFADFLGEAGQGGQVSSAPDGTVARGDGVSVAVRDVLVGQQAAVVPMGMETKSYTTQAEKDARDMLKEMTEGGLDGYWKWMTKKLREDVLSDMGLSEDALAAMDPATRASVEKAIEDEIQKRLAEAMAGGKNRLAHDGSEGETRDGTHGGARDGARDDPQGVVAALTA